MKKIAVVFFAVLLLALASCSEKSTKELYDSLPNVDYYDYGNGVYYFSRGIDDDTEAPYLFAGKFAEALSKFIAEHPNLELVSMTGDGSRQFNGQDIGYFGLF